MPDRSYKVQWDMDEAQMHRAAEKCLTNHISFRAVCVEPGKWKIFVQNEEDLVTARGG